MLLIAQQQLPELPAYGFQPTIGSLLSLAITVLLPVLVGLLTKQSWSGRTKAVLLLALSAVNAILTGWLEAVNTAADFDVVPLLYTVVINFIIAVAVHFGFWKPTGVSGSAQRSVVRDRAV